ncbi:uncharacterized protein LOC114404133 [Glycine soja]|uniref:uncharacterized protein n=1 Tax=Glycine max TaxID=3847 RepID=UPI0003DEAD38|nr:uncharacterized protein LOC102664463 [Glycine max]XP_028223037.1 uncharacterized protein LOC114404133 [Glycine soja]|eukprot:XP_006579194.1 uncharacterized protein LOC102664463 [Glycine max]
MHQILLEDDSRPVRHPQRRLNPTILDVVKKEAMKLLATGIIYPISDSTWVSPFLVVPKKSGIAVVKNQDNELISTKVANNWLHADSYSTRGPAQTTFTCPFGTFAYTKMPFGLCNAPSVMP